MADPMDFDIDVDLSPLLGIVAGPTLMSARWYELMHPRFKTPRGMT